METKKKIIHGNDVIELSFEEVFHKYKKLLHQKIQSWSKTYDYDDLFQTASIALWKAYRDYDNYNGTPFMGMLSTYVNNELLTFHNKNRPKHYRHTSQIKELTSLNEPLYEGELIDFIVENESISQEVINRIMIQEVFKELPKHKSEILTAYLSGYTQREIAAEKNVPRSTVWFYLDSIFTELRNAY